MEYIIVNEQYAQATALIQLNRPKELNALNTQLMQELREALQQLDRDDSVRAIIITAKAEA